MGSESEGVEDPQPGQAAGDGHAEDRPPHQIPREGVNLQSTSQKPARCVLAAGFWGVEFCQTFGCLGNRKPGLRLNLALSSVYLMRRCLYTFSTWATSLGLLAAVRVGRCPAHS